MLYELVFTSTSTLDEGDEQALDAILRASLRRNLAAGITGLLIHEDGMFIELLEGERDDVLALYHDIIVHDPRHQHPRICWEHVIKKRGFRDWLMGFTRARPLPLDQSPGGYLAHGVAALLAATPASAGRSIMFAIYSELKRSGEFAGRLAAGANPARR